MNASITIDRRLGAEHGKDAQLQLHMGGPCEDEPTGKSTYWMAAGHIVTALLGPAVMAMPYIFSRLGWIAAPICLTTFFVLTRWTSGMLANVYEVNGKRYKDYDSAVVHFLGRRHALFLSVSRHVNLILANIGFQIATAASITYIAAAACRTSHMPGSSGSCWSSQPVITVAVGGVQLLLSQFKDLQAVTWCSAIGAVASLAYCAITFGLAASQAHNRLGSISGTAAASAHEKLFSTINALGAIGFGLNAPIITLEVAHTLRQPPAAAVSMQKSLTLSLGACVVMFAAGGTLGYLALGDGVGDNFLLAFEGVAPVWVMFLGQIVVVLIMVPAYQVCGQPTFAVVEETLHRCKLPSCFKNKRWLLSLTFRSAYVGITTLLAVSFPAFVIILGLVGSSTFWQIAIFYPVMLNKAVYAPSKRKLSLMYAVLGVSAAVMLLALIGSVAVIAMNASKISLLKV